MASVMDFDAFGEKAFTSALAASRKSSAAGLGAHAGAEPVLVLAGAFGALKGAFHIKFRRGGGADWSGKVKEGMGVVKLRKAKSACAGRRCLAGQAGEEAGADDARVRMEMSMA